MDLDQELGKTLFIRGSRRITLTESGILLRKRAGELLDLAEKTVSELTVSEDTVAGDIYWGWRNAVRTRSDARQPRVSETIFNHKI